MLFERKDEIKKFSDKQNLNTQRTKFIETKTIANSMSLTKDKNRYKESERLKADRWKHYVMKMKNKIEEGILMSK